MRHISMNFKFRRETDLAENTKANCSMVSVHKVCCYIVVQQWIVVYAIKRILFLVYETKFH
jgi:hypothetical protein